MSSFTLQDSLGQFPEQTQVCSPEFHGLVSATCFAYLLQDISHHYLMVTVAKAAHYTPYSQSVIPCS